MFVAVQVSRVNLALLLLEVVVRLAEGVVRLAEGLIRLVEGVVCQAEALVRLAEEAAERLVLGEVEGSMLAEMAIGKV